MYLLWEAISLKWDSPYVSYFFTFLLYIFLFYFLFTYLSSPTLPFDRHRNCQVSFLFPFLLILLPSYFCVTFIVATSYSRRDSSAWGLHYSPMSSADGIFHYKPKTTSEAINSVSRFIDIFWLLLIASNIYYFSWSYNDQFHYKIQIKEKIWWILSRQRSDQFRYKICSHPWYR